MVPGAVPASRKVERTGSTSEPIIQNFRILVKSPPDLSTYDPRLPGAIHKDRNYFSCGNSSFGTNVNE